ncbi:MAG: tRNA-(ms[2]io[6]A)-hydroxylase [Chitinophagales bacterium]|nr:tRNA-(ms[2]io[6]A)-hydroxylase [Chitinophagales bacterium]
MLGLRLPTDPRWVRIAEKNIADILTDHAYCELKAATTCISLIQLYPDKSLLVERLAPVITEEWEHFRMVLEELKSRGYTLGFQRKDEYVSGLSDAAIKGGSSEDRFLDKMLMAALIEARSCERFRLLSIDINDISLRDFYHKLMKAEAFHYRMFLDLAEAYIDANKVKSRWMFWLEKEAEIMQALELRGDRVH